MFKHLKNQDKTLCFQNVSMIANKQVNQDGTYLTNRVYNPTVRFPSHEKTSLLKPLQTPKLNASHIKLPQTIFPFAKSTILQRSAAFSHPYCAFIIPFRNILHWDRRNNRFFTFYLGRRTLFQYTPEVRESQVNILNMKHQLALHR